MDSDTGTRPPHIERPHLRRILPRPVSDGTNQGMALQDPFMLTPQTMVVPTAFGPALQHLNGEWTIEELATNLKAPAEALESLVSKLDELGLLWGPTAADLEQARRDEIQNDGCLPMRQSGMLGEDADECRAKLDAWMKDAEDPEVDFEVRGLFSPRFDYPAAAHIYAGTYHAIAGKEFDRVLVLGNNQLGFGDGVVGTRWGFQSPLGRLLPDTDFITAMESRFGDTLFNDQLDHITSHGIEMQIPWLQYCLGSPRIFGCLMPDPLDQPIDETDMVSPADFIEAARSIIDELPGRTLVVATGDLSQIGPQFGEPRPIDDQRRFEAERADRELISKFTNGDADAFLAAVKWSANANRWSGVGAMSGLLGVVKPSNVELIDYCQHPLDEEGTAMIASAGLVAG